jgi:transcriptional regulator with XRE-family HTH domain
MLTIRTESPMTLADRLKQLRKQHGLTQDDLAAKAGVSIATIQRVERSESPSAATIASLASAFGMTAAALTSASEAASVEPSSGAYLPLAEITSGKRLVDLILGSPQSTSIIWRLRTKCSATCSEASTNFASRARIPPRRRILPIASASTSRRGGFSDDDDGGMPMLLATWEETCLVLRVGTGGMIVDRADVYPGMGKWTNTNDPRIVQPKSNRTNEESALE